MTPQDPAPHQDRPDGAPAAHGEHADTSPSDDVTEAEPKPKPEPEPEVTVHDNPGRHRFEVFWGPDLAGSSAYVDVEDGDHVQRVFHHTVVGEEHAGRGLAATLTRTALAESVASGHRIVAVCPYVVRWLRGHHEFDASIDPVGPKHLAALR